MLITPRSKLESKIGKLLGLSPARADTRVAVWKAHRLLYVRNPKCGNSSIISSIEGVETGRVFRKDIRRIGDDWTSFSFVRNPWARLVSTYESKVKVEPGSPRPDESDIQGFLDAGIPITGNMSFEAFCEIVCDIPDNQTEKHLRSQSSVLMHKGKLIVSYIGKVEKMQEDWDTLMELTKLNIRLLHLNRTQHGKYGAYFGNASLVNLVGDRYADDIRNFDYDFQDFA